MNKDLMDDFKRFKENIMLEFANIVHNQLKMTNDVLTDLSNRVESLEKRVYLPAEYDQRKNARKFGFLLPQERGEK